MKTVVIAGWLMILSGLIALLFWNNEWRYTQPTPLPVKYHAVPPGANLDISNYPFLKNNRPVFLHFFNPDCPCSRFNMQHFKLLAGKYKNQLQFEIVVISKRKTYTEQDIKDKLSMDLPISFDTTLADLCGVYSTPQAVIITAEHTLYYRGNYNRTRYCSDDKSSYALMAIDSLLGGITTPFFSKAASRSYGCALPNCKR